MIWVQFIVCAAILVLAAIQLAKYGDIIAARSPMSGLFIGMVLMAAASLPEMLTSFSSVLQNQPNLAAGNLLGSNMFNMFLLAGFSVIVRKERVLRTAMLKHSLSGSLTMFLIATVAFFILAKLDIAIGWVGVDSLMIIAIYIGAIWLIRSNPVGEQTDAPIDPKTPPLRKGIIGFLVASVVLVIVTPFMTRASAQIAEITGLGATFIGSTLLAIVTSLPELVSTVAAARIGANDMAIGNLFGSNLFNMFALGLTDFFYTKGPFLSAIDPSFLLITMLGMLMTGMAVIGNQARFERKIFFLEADALALILTYFTGLGFLYFRGITP